MKERQRHENNTISVEGLSLSACKKEIIYNKIKYGSHIKFKTTTTNSGGRKIYNKSIHLEKIKNRYILILAQKKECLKILPDLFVSSSVTNKTPSGTVVIMACVLDTKKFNQSSPWQSADFTKLKSCKPNILSSSSHHGSVGYYASFGNKGSFDKTTHTSVGQYVKKRSNNPIKQSSINATANSYEKRIDVQINSSVASISKFIPNIKTLISPVLETAFEIQKETGSINLQSFPSSKNGCWQTSICVDAQTSHFHTENDCTYTLISVPDQVCFKSSANSNNYSFIFKLSNTELINLNLIPGVSFIFSGMYLTHRQNKNRDETSTNDVFFNVASYGNKRLFNHIRKSINK